MIEAIFFCEFDNTLGARLVLQYPKKYLSGEVTEALLDYAIPRQDLCGKLLRIRISNFQVLGFPTCIEALRYERNQYLFNIGLVFSEKTDTFNYEHIVVRLNKTMRIIEEERGFVSQCLLKDGGVGFECSMKNIIEDINAHGHCSVIIDQNFSFDCKLLSDYSAPPEVFGHQVPVRIKEIDCLVTEDWDETVRKVLPFIDGSNDIRRISNLSGISLDLVRLAVRHYVYYDCVALIDVFQPSNIYCPTPGIGKLFDNLEIRDACVKFCVLNPDEPPPQIVNCFRLLTMINPGITIHQFMANYTPSSLNVDMRRLIIFGLVNNLIRRLHRYAMFTETLNEVPPNVPVAMISMIDGRHSFDEICSRFNIKYVEIVRILRSINCKTFLA